MFIFLARKFNVGRSSEQLYNGELAELFEALKHVAEKPTDETPEPVTEKDGAIWLDTDTNELKRYDATLKQWVPVYEKQLQVTNNLLAEHQPLDPVKSQLWIFNDVLMYYAGDKWKPVRALTQDSSQFNLSSFEDFILASPITCKESVVDKNGIDHIQSIAPSLETDKIFLNTDAYFDYTKVTPVCFDIEKELVDLARTSIIHVNPGKLTAIKKRFFKVDRLNPKISCTPTNTEYYGFHNDDPYGEFLVPRHEDNEEGYTIMDDGIFLSYDQAQNYSYVLSVTYEFSWIRSTGSLEQSLANESKQKYYVQDGYEPLALFVEGYNLEPSEYSEEALSQTFELHENVSTKEVLAMHVTRPESGFVTELNMKDQGVIKPYQKYVEPLLFVNGEALRPEIEDLEVKSGVYYINNAQRDMPWQFIELYDERTKYNMFESAGYVTDINENGTPVVKFDNKHILPDDPVVLFINGVLINPRDVIRNDTAGTLTVSNLKNDGKVRFDYILLKDRYGNLYDETKVRPAVGLNSFNESMVYVDGKLICSNTSVKELSSHDTARANGARHNEIKNFQRPNDPDENGWFVFNELKNDWDKLDESEIPICKMISSSYENTYKALRFSLELTAAQMEKTHIFAYRYASSIEYPLLITNVDVKNQKRIYTSTQYRHGLGQLRVWLDGVRIYPQTDKYDGIVEDPRGNYFDLPTEYTGRVTYIIERTERSQTESCTSEVLDETNLVPGHINIYRTQKSLYPGRVTVYINGIRMSKDDFTIFDNHTLLIENKEALIGPADNYPEEKVLGETKTIHHDIADCILVEVRQDERQEHTATIKDFPCYEIPVSDYGLENTILESQDEVLIFVDGLFFGSKMNEGYRIDSVKGKITLLDESLTDALNNDTVAMELHTNDKVALEYLLSHDGKEYTRNKEKLTFEWR